MKLKNIIGAFACALPLSLSAQYYDQGPAPASVKWDVVQTRHSKLIFPRDYRSHAMRVMHYLDTLRTAVGYGYRVQPLRMPIVLQTHNFASNGLVMLAPRRMELITVPPAAMTAEPWLKQLTAHEARHTVQYALMNRNFIKFASFVLGDQGSLLGVALFPLWAMEGDAVLAETQLSTFGRGRQPSFTIEYRAMLAEKPWRRYAVDKWFCGSMRDFMPDHYQWGYQMTSYAWTRYGENIWDRLGEYSSKYPFLIFTTKIGMWKYYRSSVNRLSRAMLADLDAYWDSLPLRDNSAQIIPTRTTSHTAYSSPIYAGGRVVALKKDMDTPERVVSVDPGSGSERVLFHTGYIHSPLSLCEGRLVWSELRRSKLWAQKVNSQICTADLASGRKTVMRGERQGMFPVALPGGGTAYVHYDYQGSYSIRLAGCEEPLRSFEMPTSLHGLAWDAVTERYYYIAVGETGMYIGSLDARGNDTGVVKQPGYATLGNLRAEGGALYFSSTQSGYDEAHRLVIATGLETRLTTSRYGSFAPAPAGADSIVSTTYTAGGYMLSRQITGGGVDVDPSPMPMDAVNPPRHQWEKPLNMDKVTVADTTERHVRKYRRGLHALNVHSWAPTSFDPHSVTGEREANINAGVTVLSQDLLNTTFFTGRWGWTDQGSLLNATLSYYGWTPKVEFETEWGGGDQPVYIVRRGVVPPDPKAYLALEGRVFLPMYFDGGYHTRLIRPMVDLQYSNALIYEPDGSDTHGIYKLLYELQYSEQVRMAERDILPRWGWAVRANMATEPFNDNFSKLYTAYARLNTPGLWPHHSLMLRGAMQWQQDGIYRFAQKEVFPVGADYNNLAPERYRSVAADYQLPVAYPDIGIASLVYLKRIRLNVGGTYARYRLVEGGEWSDVWSYGCDVTIDTNMLRAPAAATNQVSVSIYRPSDRKGVWCGFNITVPL